MKLEVQRSKFKFPSSNAENILALRVVAILRASFFCFTAHAAFAQNDLQKIADGGYVEKWLVSNVFPAEIDAGTWENFNRFNIENLPQKDWLAPFGGVRRIKPQTGTQKAGFKIDGRTNPEEKIEPANTPLPEVGAASKTQNFRRRFRNHLARSRYW